MCIVHRIITVVFAHYFNTWCAVDNKGNDFVRISVRERVKENKYHNNLGSWRDNIDCFFNDCQHYFNGIDFTKL